MATATSHRRRLLRWTAAAVWLRVGTAPVAAHGAPSAGGRGVALPVVVGVATAFGLAAGIVVAAGRNTLSLPGRPDLLSRAVGPLLVAIGISATVSVFEGQFRIAVAGWALGVAAGSLVAVRGGCGRCDDVAVGAIAFHRFFEGLVVAALSTAGSSVGTVGVAVLSVHTVVECVAIGSQSTRSPAEAVGAVVAVSGVFVLGALVGTAGLFVTESGVGAQATALAGGLLIALGVDELRPSTNDGHPAPLSR